MSASKASLSCSSHTIPRSPDWATGRSTCATARSLKTVRWEELPAESPSREANPCVQAGRQARSPARPRWPEQAHQHTEAPAPRNSWPWLHLPVLTHLEHLHDNRRGIQSHGGKSFEVERGCGVLLA